MIHNVFIEVRMGTYFVIFLASVIVLAISSHFAVIFLPQFHADIIVFGLLVSAVTITTIVLVLLRSQPRWDVVLLFVMAALWLALAAFATDYIGHIQCIDLTGQTTQTNSGSISAVQYCRELKVILSFSWANFAILTLSFIVLLALILRVQAQGRQYAWRESMSNIPWFGAPGYYMPMQYGAGAAGMPGQYYPMGAYPGVVYQQPGASVVVQQTASGVPFVSQVPGAFPPRAMSAM